MNDVSLYINFVLHAVLGRLGEADTLLREAGSSIRKVARYLTKTQPVTPKQLYRGMLLDPTLPFRPNPHFTFLSWSEDKDVAQWFACTRSTISEPLAESNPKLRGHIITLSPPLPSLLFHHSWARGVAPLARMHPLMGEEGQRQIEWSLKTQSEVITESLATLKPEITKEIDDETLAYLESRLAPPWMK